MIELLPAALVALSSFSASPASSVPSIQPVADAPVTLQAQPLRFRTDPEQLRTRRMAQGEASVPLPMTEMHVERDTNGKLVARCRVVGSPNLQGVLRPQLLMRELPR